MKGMVKIIIAVSVIFTAVVGALIVFDKLTNKNRLEDDYLDCNEENEVWVAHHAFRAWTEAAWLGIPEIYHYFGELPKEFVCLLNPYFQLKQLFS